MTSCYSTRELALYRSIRSSLGGVAVWSTRKLFGRVEVELRVAKAHLRQGDVLPAQGFVDLETIT